MSAKRHVLIVEDTLPMAVWYQEYLRGAAWDVALAGSLAQARARIDLRVPDAIVIDVGLPDGSGIDLLREIRAKGLPTEAIVVTGSGSMKLAIEAMREGAYDFLVKPFDRDRLTVTLRNALERRNLADTVVELRQEFGRDRYYGFVGASLPMQAVYRIIDSAAQSKATVFVTGESGTGKEVCAEAIHKRSPRAKGPFVALNCAAIPKDLLESEIFGHVKGAFTGATADRAGAALQAHRGTLFLDEIGEMDLNLQGKLLRFLQTGRVQRVGDSAPQDVDVRIVCATNRDPAAEVAAGRFREDLFYRLHVIPIALPPLREREGDVLLIARELLRRYATEERKRFAEFTAEAEALLAGYAWPGNVRELQNVVRSAVVLHDGDAVDVGMLPDKLRGRAVVAMSRLAANANGPYAISPGAPGSPLRPMWRIERDAIEAAIAACAGNVRRAAAFLEIDASTIYRKKQLWEGRERA
ncbi:MAG: sigma-54-dependent Fis family transcriptional regulator [Alphaproteobacteria bacterium]|nr:sigma-54-dependent Fis family transcriptional regulator [Alphaproteobacteria bacterium]